MSYGKLSTLSEISPPMSGGPREPMLLMSIAGRRRRDTARQEVVSEHVRATRSTDLQSVTVLA